MVQNWNHIDLDLWSLTTIIYSLISEFKWKFREEYPSRRSCDTGHEVSDLDFWPFEQQNVNISTFKSKWTFVVKSSDMVITRMEVTVTLTFDFGEPKFNYFILESRCMSVPNLKKFTGGISLILLLQIEDTETSSMNQSRCQILKKTSEGVPVIMHSQGWYRHAVTLTLTFDHQNLMIWSFSPSGCFWQPWKKKYL